MEQNTDTDTGLLTIAMPAGQHSATLRLGPLPQEIIGGLVSIGGLLAWWGALWWQRRARRR